MSLGLCPTFEDAATTQTFVIKPHVGRITPVRVTFGSASATVVYDLMTHRTVRAGRLEAHGVLEGKDVPLMMHFRAKRKPKLDLSITIKPQPRGKSIRVVKKFVQLKRALRESGQIEVFSPESGGRSCLLENS
jgi:hypothetical protein